MSTPTTFTFRSRTDHDTTTVISAADNRGRAWTFVSTADGHDTIIDYNGDHFEIVAPYGDVSGQHAAPIHEVFVDWLMTAPEAV